MMTSSHHHGGIWPYHGTYGSSQASYWQNLNLESVATAQLAVSLFPEKISMGAAHILSSVATVRSVHPSVRSFV